MKIAVCVHLYHIDMIDSITNYLSNLECEYDLFISLVKNYPISFINKLKKINKNVKIFIVENRGMDIGGFLSIYKEIDDTYDLILKIHTKKGIGSITNPSIHAKKHGLKSSVERGEKWYNTLMNSVLGNKEKVKQILNEFENNPKCGMIGHQKNNKFHKNRNECDKILDMLNVKIDYDNTFFVGGTIFWVRNFIFKKHLTNQNIDKILEISPLGYVSEPSINHAMERIFGSLVYAENKELIIIK